MQDQRSGRGDIRWRLATGAGSRPRLCLQLSPSHSSGCASAPSVFQAERNPSSAIGERVMGA